MATRKKLIMLALFIFSMVALAACGDTPQGTPGVNTPAGSAQFDAPGLDPVGEVIKTDKGQYTNISADELKAMLEKKDFFLVDVHIPNEGKLPDLDARIPYNEIAQHLDQLPQDKGAKIVLTCRSDHMSTIASTELADLGYTNVFNLEGGFNAWKAKGYPFTPEP